MAAHSCIPELGRQRQEGLEFKVCLELHSETISVWYLVGAQKAFVLHHELVSCPSSTFPGQTAQDCFHRVLAQASHSASSSWVTVVALVPTPPDAQEGLVSE